MSKAHRRTVEAGYDRMAERYLATKDPEDPLALAALEIWRPSCHRKPACWILVAALVCL